MRLKSHILDIALLHTAGDFLGEIDKSIHLRAPQGQYGQDQEDQGSFDAEHIPDPFIKCQDYS